VRPYAYLPYFTPRYLPRLRHALRASGLRLSSLLQLSRGPIRILDLGAGTGILTLACLLELERACQELGVGAEVEAVLRDSNEDSLNVASQLLQITNQTGAWPHLKVHSEFQCCDVRSNSGKGLFDVVLLGHVLCEFYQRREIDRDQLNGILGQILRVVEGQLSSRGVVVIIEPVDRDHVSKLLWIRDYARMTSKLSVLAPCLGTSLYCPEEGSPYSGRPACSGSTYVTTWDDTTLAGHRLRLFTQGLLWEKGLTQAPPFSRSWFFPLVLSLGAREPVPEGVGMAVRRRALASEKWKTRNVEIVCVVGTQGGERIQAFPKPGSNANGAILRAIDVRDWGLTDIAGSEPTADTKEFDLSALYLNGWPVVT
jgi:SAM-dependent methyltransferase